jgi:Mg-chelatase subunit ChlD
MGLLFGGGGGSSSRPAKDGSRATIKYIDLSSFYQDDAGKVALRLDIHNPQSQPLLGLNKDMLTLTEQGSPAEILQFNGPGTQALNVILVIDVSGSMDEQNKMQGAVDAALAAVDELQVDRDRLGVISFDNQFDILQPLTKMTRDAKAACRQRISMLRPRGGTSIGPPTLAALNLFQQALPDGPKLLMVMTDGEDSGLPSLVEMIVERSETTGVPLYTISFGGQLDDRTTSVLRSLAQQCNGQYFHAPSGEQLAEIYHSPFPRADGLPRNVALKIDAPVGTLSAGKSYSIGSIVDSGGRQPAASGGGKPAVGGGVSSAAKLAIFVMLFIGLSAALALPSLQELRKADGSTGAAPSSGAGTAAAGQRPASSPAMSGIAGRGPKSPPRPPGKSAPTPPAPARPTTDPKSAAPKSAAPKSAAPAAPAPRPPVPVPAPAPRPSTPAAKPAPRPAAPPSPAPTGNRETTLPTPPPPPKPTGGPRPLPPSTSSGNKQTIRPIPPPPPPPGGSTS